MVPLLRGHRGGHGARQPRRRRGRSRRDPFHSPPHPIAGWDLGRRAVLRGGIACTQAVVDVQDDAVSRSHGHIVGIDHRGTAPPAGHVPGPRRLRRPGPGGGPPPPALGRAGPPPRGRWPRCHRRRRGNGGRLGGPRDRRGPGVAGRDRHRHRSGRSRPPPQPRAGRGRPPAGRPRAWGRHTARADHPDRRGPARGSGDLLRSPPGHDRDPIRLRGGCPGPGGASQLHPGGPRHRRDPRPGCRRRATGDRARGHRRRRDRRAAGAGGRATCSRRAHTTPG